MPKYFSFKVAGYFLYFTSHCIVEAMHAHASDGNLTEAGSAKFFVRADGTTSVVERGRLTAREVRLIQAFIKDNHADMYAMWQAWSAEGYFEG